MHDRPLATPCHAARKWQDPHCSVSDVAALDKIDTFAHLVSKCHHGLFTILRLCCRSRSLEFETLQPKEHAILNSGSIFFRGPSLSCGHCFCCIYGPVLLCFDRVLWLGVLDNLHWLCGCACTSTSTRGEVIAKSCILG